MRAATAVQQLCKSCTTCFKYYCMFYFTCERSLIPQTPRGVRRGGQEGLVPIPGNSYAEKIGVLVNTLLQWLSAYMSSAPHYGGSVPGPRWGTSGPNPPVLSPSETNFWLRLCKHPSSWRDVDASLRHVSFSRADIEGRGGEGVKQVQHGGEASVTHSTMTDQ